MTDGQVQTQASGWRSRLRRLRTWILPQMPDFYGLLIEQCAVTADGTSKLVQFLSDGANELGAEVRRLEHEGDRLKARNLEVLHRSFATPMDREDIYDAIESIDEILNYAKTTVREIEILGVTPDEHMRAMAELVNAGAQALLLGCQHLEHDPKAADGYGEQARKSERSVEKVYRRALAALFNPELQLQELARIAGKDLANAGDEGMGDHPADVLATVTQMLKRREIYRHLSNAADHVSHAAQVLEDIVNKAT